MFAALVLLASAVPAQEATVLNDHLWKLPHLGLEVREQRVLDPSAGTVRSIATLSDGTRVDLNALRNEEQRRKIEAAGHISHELWDRIGSTPSGELIHVVFWLRAEDSPDFRQILRDAEAAGMTGEDARRLARDQAESFFAERNAGFAEQLAAADIEVTQVTGPWPLVFAQVPVDDILLWAANPAVDMAYYVFPTWASELDNAQGTMRTFTVWDRGITGAGSPVKTMVNDTGDVTTSNPWLPPIVKITSIGTGSHASSVAGNICFDHPTLKGAAFGIPQLYSGGGSGDTAAPNVWNSAITFGVSFGNCSWWNFNKGSIVFLDRFFDYTLRNFGMMMFKSTGNQGNTSTPYTTTPGNAYNTTNSGAYSDNNNVAWAGDSMASYSSYWDPVEGHEKPELANAGDGVATASISGTTSSFSGTSSASPLTCGVATLLATRDNSLMTEPESIKCILMASAWHNVEGADVLSEKDGAGAVHAAAADSVARDGQFQNGTLTNASFSGGNFDVPFMAFANDETRVCALWFSNANSAHTTDVLDMDVDLVILDPSGSTVASSAFTLNPFEILKFTPATTGMHTARLVRQRFNGSSEGYCVAWSSRQDMSVAEVEIQGTPSLGASLTVTFREQYDGGAFYQAHVSGGTLPNVVNLGGGWVLPLRADSNFTKSANWSGFSGTLGSGGSFTTFRTVPNRPGLIGKTFYVAMYTKPNAGSSTISGTSEPVPVTVVP